MPMRNQMEVDKNCHFRQLFPLIDKVPNLHPPLQNAYQVVSYCYYQLSIWRNHMQEHYIPNPEDQHDKNYIECKAAIAEIVRISAGIDRILLMSHNKGMAAKIIREQWDPKMDVALEKVKISLAKWMVGMHSLAEY